jgi:hypothetical protein
VTPAERPPRLSYGRGPPRRAPLAPGLRIRPALEASRGTPRVAPPCGGRWAAGCRDNKRRLFSVAIPSMSITVRSQRRGHHRFQDHHYRIAAGSPPVSFLPDKEADVVQPLAVLGRGAGRRSRCRCLLHELTSRQNESASATPQANRGLTKGDWARQSSLECSTWTHAIVLARLNTDT